MKKFIISVFILCLSIPVFAEVNLYIAVRGGYEKSKQKTNYESFWAEYGEPGITNIGGGSLFDDTAVLGIFAIGTDINQFRLEIAYSYKLIKEGMSVLNGEGIPQDYLNYNDKIKQQTLLANLFYYPLHTMAINPFIGAGAGLGTLKIYDFDTKYKFAYALYIGADYTFAKHFTLELMGTYNSIISPYSNAKDVQNFGGSLGVRYNFN